MKTTKKRTVKPKTDNYTASIKVLGRTLTSSGPSIKEALWALEGRNIKGHGVLTVTHGDVKKDRILNGGQVFRLFSGSKVTREITVKNISFLFDGI